MDYWSLTNKELITVCKRLGVSRWSGKRKKDLIAMIKVAEQAPPVPAPTPAPTPIPTPPPEPEPYEMLDATLLAHANQVLASLPKSPESQD